MASTNYKVGDWFAVPLREPGHAIGLIARGNREGVLLGYFFGPRRGSVPSLTDVQGLRPDDAILVGRFGHLGLKQGRWPILGRVRDWEPSAWPTPVFVRHEELSGRSIRIVYDDDDPNRVLSEEVIASSGTEQGPKDGLMGAGFVEKVLTTATR